MRNGRLRTQSYICRYVAVSGGEWEAYNGSHEGCYRGGYEEAYGTSRMTYFIHAGCLKLANRLAEENFNADWPLLRDAMVANGDLP
mmetsp:Transcript_5198/g.8201  ORF Transcript_5198/g.8201 Transcript_5198/m.8201 type:complete len:86 (+) Transcript_5198:214-471(+)